MKSIISLSALGLAIVALVSAAVNPFPPPPLSGPFKNCALGETVMNVTSVVLDPNPPCIGKEFCIVLNGTLSEPIIAGGQMTIIGRWLSKIVYSYSGNAMDGLVAQGYPNPVPVTTKSIKYCYTLSPNMWNNVPTQYNFLMMNGDGHVVLNQCGTVIATATNCLV